MDDSAAAQILAGLNDEQRAGVTSDAQLLVIRAGAGSGKTRVLTRRIAYGAATDQIDPRRVLALTFTRKAAGELNLRLRQLGLRQSAAAGTFHAIALSQLRQKWTERGEAEPTLLDRKIGFVARLVPRVNDRTTPLELVSEIEWAKARRILPEKYAEAAEVHNRKPPMEPERVARVYEDYEEMKAKRNLIDFDDILILCGRMLQRDRSAAEAFRWSFRHLFVDEFQDVNPLQFALLKVFAGPEPHLCVVGDSRQAIYAWNGADSSYLDNFADHFPGAQTVSLKQNYRSTPEILRCASALLPTSGKLAPTLPSGPAPTIASHANDKAEARAIARMLRNTRSQRVRWRDMSVLVRTNAQVAVLANALAEADVPVSARGEGKLIERPEVLDAIDQMHRLGQPLSTSLDDLAARLAEPDDDELDEDQPELTAPDASAQDDDGDRVEAGSQRQQLLEAFIRLGRDHLAVDPNATIKSFVDALKAGTNEAATAGGDRVDVTTFHQAKGLEWEVVHVAGMERGLSPIGHAKTPDALAEEHRLIYVALTRAKRQLHLHWAEERRFGDRVSNRKPSPMLDDIGAAIRGEDPRSSRSRNAQKAASARKNLSAKNGGLLKPDQDESDPVFQALKAWRLSIARANDVPAFVIFNNKTLHAIAHDRPDDKRSLLNVTGVGPAKAEQYGEDVLRLVAEAANASG